MKIKSSHLKLAWNAVVGHIYKLILMIKDIPTLHPTILSNPDIIVSLTSYGRRVEETVYYTILSILHQTKRPDRIILWLDSDNWNEKNIPSKLQLLKEHGVEIRFCEDIRSYKKLIPTLRLFPDSIIITVDDDVIYKKSLIENLYNSYLRDTSKIYCTRAYNIPIKDHKPLPYKNWVNYHGYSATQPILFPVGVGGILYPPNSLAHEVLNANRFMKICPSADDIWFWIMARLKGTEHCFVPMDYSFYSFDAIYQAMHRGSALTHSNVGERNNDEQMKNALDAYNEVVLG